MFGHFFSSIVRFAGIGLLKLRHLPLRCRQCRSMAPSRTRSPRMPSPWAATFETTCSLKFQQRLPTEVKGAKLLIGFVTADIILKSEASTRLLSPKLLSLPQSMATGIHLLGLSIEPLSVAIISITQDFVSQILLGSRRSRTTHSPEQRARRDDRKHGIKRDWPCLWSVADRRRTKDSAH